MTNNLDGGFKMKTIKIKYHYGDHGLCSDTFITVDEPKRYFNRCTVTGVWFTCYPAQGYYEHSSTVDEDVQFQIVEDGKIKFLDGNSKEAATKPFATYEKDIKWFKHGL